MEGGGGARERGRKTEREGPRVRVRERVGKSDKVFLAHWLLLTIAMTTHHIADLLEDAGLKVHLLEQCPNDAAPLTSSHLLQLPHRYTTSWRKGRRLLTGGVFLCADVIKQIREQFT